MSSPRLIVIGGSAGGVEALSTLLPALPEDLPAAVLVALHLSPTSRSLLAEILDRRCRVPVRAAEPGEQLRPGTVTVAVPDRHLLVQDGSVLLGAGARENGYRPSIDTMLRSAALDAGTRVTGVVLTGLLDDGAAGLACVARYGGTCLVQDPKEAQFPDMPRNALMAVPSATRVSLAALPEELVRIVTDPPPEAPAVPEDQRRHDLAELASALGESTRLPDGRLLGEPSPYACPDCHGVLNRMPDPDHVLRFRCRTGHAWTADSLLAEQETAVEDALWAAVRALEERADISARLADRAEHQDRRWSQEHYRERVDDALQSAAVLRGLLQTSMSSELPPSGT